MTQYRIKIHFTLCVVCAGLCLCGVLGVGLDDIELEVYYDGFNGSDAGFDVLLRTRKITLIFGEIATSIAIRSKNDFVYYESQSGATQSLFLPATFLDSYKSATLGEV